MLFLHYSNSKGPFRQAVVSCLFLPVEKLPPCTLCVRTVTASSGTARSVLCANQWVALQCLYETHLLVVTDVWRIQFTLDADGLCPGSAVLDAAWFVCARSRAVLRPDAEVAGLNGL